VANIYCEWCDCYIDLDVDVDHVEDHEAEEIDDDPTD